MGEYHELTDQIILTWTFPEAERQNITFELQMSINDEPFSVLSLSDEMQHIIFNPESDATYRFKVTAVSTLNEQLRSDPIDLTVIVPKKWEEEEPDEEDPNIITIPNPIDVIGGGDDDDDDDDDDDEESDN
jgi:penicillin-binding protein 1A